MSPLAIVLWSLLFFAILYVVIETAVRRGIDSSETNELLRELVEIHRNQSNKSAS
ncbi:hypothetical protein [Bacillus suaedaesalsae]|uniref:CcmD family protein n=1 Tax=Bacillus suaedaesalsae TaxID=2810349 RepID=A0ABS2DFZ9_9BACI|nr:hypothetical protein [Bacillus suaedaesalsae]MBM6617405.1 hypothetical protein [Bacillus suaedaesalsae]